MRLILLSALISMTSAVQSSAIDFDNITNADYEILTDHGGFTWSNTELVSNNAYQNDYGNTYGSTSGNYAIGGNTLDSIIISGNLFDFTGIHISSWASYDSFDQFAATELTVTGYNGSSVVGSITTDLFSNQYSWLSTNFTGVTSVVFESTGAEKWWMMDDFTYESTVVPIPSALWLMISGSLVLLGFSKNRSRTHQ